MILCLRRLASGAWKARRSKSTAAPQLLAVVLVLISCPTGRCDFAILRLASNPETFVKNGSELNLECKSTLPLLGDPEVAECTWILHHLGEEYAEVSFRGSKKVSGSGADRGLRELVRAERTVTKDRRDCNVKISQTDMWMEGNWYCSTVSFDGRRVTSNSMNNGGVGKLPIWVYSGRYQARKLNKHNS